MDLYVLCRKGFRACLIGAFCLLVLSCGHPATARTKSPTRDENAGLSSLSRKKNVKIATIGHRPITVGADDSPQRIVDRAISHWRGRFAQVLPDKPDLIVVPEACDRPSGLSKERVFSYYEVRKNRVRDFFAETAKANNCYIVYSAVRQVMDGTWRNSCVMLDRKGKVAAIYDKNYPTIGEIEQGILPGSDIAIADCDFGRVGFAICFDLNFDELRLRYARAKPDLMVFASMYHGGLMQAYWAYSCRSHFVGAVAGLPSEIRNPLGGIVATNTNYFDFAVATVNLDCAMAHLDFNWAKLRALKKKYGRGVTVTDPGHLGSVLISANKAETGVMDMVKEFDIELLDDYFKRAADYRNKHVDTK